MIYLESSSQSSFWLACPGSRAKPLQETWKHKQLNEGNFHGFSEFSSLFAGIFWKQFQSLQGGQVFDFQFFDGICMKSLVFFFIFGSRAIHKIHQTILDNFHHFSEILSLESAAMQKSTIDSERQFWTAPDPNSARVLIRSRYLLWPLDPQTVSSENREKIVLLGHFLVFFVM